jgi:DNA replication protein DnaC
MTPDDHLAWIETRVAAVRAHMPARFNQCRLERVEAQAWCERHLTGNTGNLMLTGNVGTGKTGNAWACWPHLIGLGWIGTWQALSEPAFLDAQLSGGDRTVAQAATDTDLLVLDDVGSANVTDWSRSRLTALLDQRWQHQRPTIVTTNLTAAPLKAHLGERALSRLADNLTTVRMLGTDRRTA